MFFSKKTQRIEHIGPDNIVIIEIYKTGSKTFKLFCDVKKASGTIGVNKHYCLEMLTQNGFSLLADNRQLCICEIDMKRSQTQTVKQIEDGFATFKSLADII